MVSNPPVEDSPMAASPSCDVDLTASLDPAADPLAAESAEPALESSSRNTTSGGTEFESAGP
jgi:hypothetical protein